MKPDEGSDTENMTAPGWNGITLLSSAKASSELNKLPKLQLRKQVLTVVVFQRKDFWKNLRKIFPKTNYISWFIFENGLMMRSVKKKNLLPTPMNPWLEVRRCKWSHRKRWALQALAYLGEKKNVQEETERAWTLPSGRDERLGRTAKSPVDACHGGDEIRALVQVHGAWLSP